MELVAMAALRVVRAIPAMQGITAQVVQVVLRVARAIPAMQVTPEILAQVVVGVLAEQAEIILAHPELVMADRGVQLVPLGLMELRVVRVMQVLEQLLGVMEARVMQALPVMQVLEQLVAEQAMQAV